MPIAARWRLLTALPPTRGRDPLPGVYEVADRDKRIIYIGHSARDVPNRLRQHLGRNRCIVEQGCYWRYAYSRVPRADEAALLASYRAAHDRLPPCNRAEALVRDGRKRYLERSGGE